MPGLITRRIPRQVRPRRHDGAAVPVDHVTEAVM
jgi:hypothetical protein